MAEMNFTGFCMSEDEIELTRHAEKFIKRHGSLNESEFLPTLSSTHQDVLKTCPQSHDVTMEDTPASCSAVTSSLVGANASSDTEFDSVATLDEGGNNELSSSFIHDVTMEDTPETCSAVTSSLVGASTSSHTECDSIATLGDGGNNEPSVSLISNDQLHYATINQSDIDSIDDEIMDVNLPYTVTLGNAVPKVYLVLNGGRNKGHWNLIIAPYGHELQINKRGAKGVIKLRCKFRRDVEVCCKFRASINTIESLISKYSLDEEFDIKELKLDEDIFFEKTAHSANCPVQPGRLEIVHLWMKLRQMAKNPEYSQRKASEIVDLARSHCITKNTNEYYVPTNPKLISFVNRRRQPNTKPPKPDGSDLSTWILQTHQLTDAVPDNFYRGRVLSEYEENVRYHYIFFSDEQKSLLHQVKHISLDGTRKVVDRPHIQLVTIHGIINRPRQRKLSAPLAYILMGGQAESDYIAVFQAIKDIIENINPIQIKTIMVDYEKALWNSARKVFGRHVKVRGCWFHINQAVYRRVQKLELEVSYLTQTQTFKIIRQILTLPLIDSNNIPILFRDLEALHVETLNGNRALRELFAYFKKNWIEGDKFQPKDWSCFGKAVRTNNYIESWNCHIYKKGGDNPLTIYKLCELLGKDAVSAMSNLQHYNKYMYVNKSQIEKSEAIKDAWQRYKQHNNAMTALEDLREVTSKFFPTILRNLYVGDVTIEDSEDETN